MHGFIGGIPSCPRLSLCVIELAAAIDEFDTVTSRMRSALTRGTPLDFVESLFRVDPLRVGGDDLGDFGEAILSRLSEYPCFVPVMLSTLWGTGTLASLLLGDGLMCARLRECCLSALVGPFDVRSSVVNWLWRSWLLCEEARRSQVLKFAVFVEIVDDDLPGDLEEEIRQLLAAIIEQQTAGDCE